MLKKLLNPVAKIYVKYALKKRGNPFELFKVKKMGVALPPAEKGVVFVGPIRMSAEAHLFEGIIGYAYRLRGYKVYAVMCGQKLADCETLPHDSSFTAVKCATCFNQQRLFCETFEIEPLYLGDYINSQEENAIEKSLPELEIDKMEFNGVDIESHVSSGIMRVLKKSSLSPDNLPLVRRFGKTTMITMTAARNMMKEFRPEHLIMSHGTYSTWGALILAAEQENVHTVVWGRGYVGKGNILATHNGSYLFKNILEPKSNFENLQLTEEQLNKTRAYFEGKRNPKKGVDYISYYSGNKNTGDQVDIYKQLNIPKDKVIVGMFPNIPWDGQAFSYSPVFPSIREFVRTTIEWFKGKDAYLIIRAHPAEMHSRSSGQLETFQDILEQLYPTLPENVIFLPADASITSYQLESSISTALLYAGTIGLEFAVNNTSVIQAGKNAFSDKGFIFEPDSLNDFHQLLTKASEKELDMTEDMKEMALKYAYHWIFRRHFPETIISFEGAQQFKGYNFTSTKEILDNEELRQFMECIDQHKDFVYQPKL